jgi:hypothetical protein
MQLHQYHDDTDEAPTVDAGNLSVSLMVGRPAVSVVLARARCLSSIPFDIRDLRLRSDASWSGCVQKAQTSRGLTKVASENEQIKDLFRRREGRILGLRRQIHHPAETRKLNLPFEVGIVLGARNKRWASNSMTVRSRGNCQAIPKKGCAIAINREVKVFMLHNCDFCNEPLALEVERGFSTNRLSCNLYRRQRSKTASK